MSLQTHPKENDFAKLAKTQKAVIKPYSTSWADMLFKSSEPKITVSETNKFLAE